MDFLLKLCPDIVSSSAALPSTIPGTGGSEQPVSDVGNPFQLRSILSSVDHAFSKAIADIEGEQSQVAASGETDPIVQRLKGWQKELLDIMQAGGNTGMNGTGGVSGIGGMQGRETAGSGGPSAQEGGLYTD
jgi:hypothetical protein